MPQYINTSILTHRIRNDIDTSTSSLEKSLERLSSGQRINRAADDAAGMAIASRMSAQVRGMEVAKRNALDGISMVQVADGALGSQEEIMQRMREIAVVASNGMLSQSDRNTLHNELSLMSGEHVKVGDDTNFNGRKLLDGSLNIPLQVGANQGETRIITLDDTRASTLNILAETFTIVGAPGSEVWTSDATGASGAAGTPGTTSAGYINVQTQSNAMAAISVIDTAIDAVNTSRAKTGTYQNRLENVINGLDVFTATETMAMSRIRDADFAKETSNMTKNQIMSQAGIAMLSQANQIPQNVLSLIK